MAQESLKHSLHYFHEMNKEEHTKSQKSLENLQHLSNSVIQNQKITFEQQIQLHSNQKVIMDMHEDTKQVSLL